MSRIGAPALRDAVLDGVLCELGRASLDVATSDAYRRELADVAVTGRIGLA